MRTLLCLLACLVGGAASATDVYRWVDENGQAHYSDQAVPGAERIHLESVQTYQPTPAPSGGRPAPSTRGPSSASSRYISLEIVSPRPEDSQWSNDQVPVTVKVTPPLREGDSVRISLDGQVVQTLPPGLNSVELSGVTRGTHTLTADVINPDGQVSLSSAPVQFTLHQPSLRNPVTTRPH